MAFFEFLEEEDQQLQRCQLPEIVRLWKHVIVHLDSKVFPSWLIKCKGTITLTHALGKRNSIPFLTWYHRRWPLHPLPEPQTLKVCEQGAVQLIEWLLRQKLAHYNPQTADALMRASARGKSSAAFSCYLRLAKAHTRAFLGHELLYASVASGQVGIVQEIFANLEKDVLSTVDYTRLCREVTACGSTEIAHYLFRRSPSAWQQFTLQSVCHVQLLELAVVTHKTIDDIAGFLQESVQLPCTTDKQALAICQFADQRWPQNMSIYHKQKLVDQLVKRGFVKTLTWLLARPSLE